MQVRPQDDVWEAIRQGEALLDRDRTAEQRRRERLATADRLRRQAEQPEHRQRRAALLETARALEERARKAPLRLVDG